MKWYQEDKGEQCLPWSTLLVGGADGRVVARHELPNTKGRPEEPLRMFLAYDIAVPLDLS